MPNATKKTKRLKKIGKTKRRFFKKKISGAKFNQKKCEWIVDDYNILQMKSSSVPLLKSPSGNSRIEYAIDDSDREDDILEIPLHNYIGCEYDEKNRDFEKPFLSDGEYDEEHRDLGMPSHTDGIDCEYVLSDVEYDEVNRDLGMPSHADGEYVKENRDVEMPFLSDDEYENRDMGMPLHIDREYVEENRDVGMPFLSDYECGEKNRQLEIPLYKLAPATSTIKSGNVNRKIAGAKNMGVFVLDDVLLDTPGQNERQQTDDSDILIDVWQIISGGNPYCAEVLKQYKRYKTLSSGNRIIILDAIIQYARTEKISILGLWSDISSQICRIFPTEQQSTYFKMLPGNKKSGKLYHRYYYKRRIDCEELEDYKDDNEMSSDLIDSIESLKIVGKSDEYYATNWRKSFEYRRQRMSKYETFDDLIIDWPIIGKRMGPYLIDMDFTEMYGAKTISSKNWNDFFSKNWISITKKIKNGKGITLSKRVARLTESTSKDAAMSILLHFLLAPAYASKNKNKTAKNKKMGRKPSFVDSRNTFLKYIKNEDVDSVIKNRNTECFNNGVKWHPYIVGYGPSIFKLKHFYVIIHTIKVKADNFLAALDLATKTFAVLNIPFPHESKAVWTLISKIFYNLNVNETMTSRICELINDLK